jgi:large subunit ribosomal protein L23
MSALRAKKVKTTSVIAPKTKQHVNAKPMTLKPKISEKGYALSENLNTYIFEVERDANKIDIASAVNAQFDVTAIKVRIASVPGKSVRSYRKKGRKSISAKRSEVRKAYVTLKVGDKLPIYAAVDDPEAPKEAK